MSTSTTGTSLDTIVLDTNADDLTGRIGAQRTFSPILETDDTNPFLDPPTSKASSQGAGLDNASKAKSKSSLKGSRVSFDQEDQFDASDEGFRKQREHFQKHKSHSTSEHKNQLIKVSFLLLKMGFMHPRGKASQFNSRKFCSQLTTVSMENDMKQILTPPFSALFQELRHLLATDNRRQFQGKKHVSLDVQSSKVLEELLKASSSEDDFEGSRKQFQERKHKSLDARHISFKFEKEPSPSSSDEDFEPSASLLKIDADITKPVIIDMKVNCDDHDHMTQFHANLVAHFQDLDSSEDEDYVSSRKQFQQSKSMSTDSRKSIRFFEMEMGTKEENIRSAVPFVRQITEDGKPMLEVYRPTTNPIFIWTQVTSYP